jgi:hypothetical protein
MNLSEEVDLEDCIFFDNYLWPGGLFWFDYDSILPFRVSIKVGIGNCIIPNT